MVNLAAFIEALKLIWIRRLLQSDSKWQDFVKRNYITRKINRVQYRMHHEGIDKYKKNPFWIDVFQSLIKYNEELVVDDESYQKVQYYITKTY